METLKTRKGSSFSNISECMTDCTFNIYIVFDVYKQNFMAKLVTKIIEFCIAKFSKS